MDAVVTFSQRGQKTSTIMGKHYFDTYCLVDGHRPYNDPFRFSKFGKNIRDKMHLHHLCLPELVWTGNVRGRHSLSKLTKANKGDAGEGARGTRRREGDGPTQPQQQKAIWTKRPHPQPQQTNIILTPPCCSS
jgi:hypothetical protein